MRISQLKIKIDATVAKCADVDNVPGCSFATPPSSNCLSDAALAAAESLVEAVWEEY